MGFPLAAFLTYLRLKSRLKRLPQPSNVHWNGFSPVCTNWWRFNLLDSTKALPHSAHTWTRGPCVCRCLRIAELSRNILLQPLCGQAATERPLENQGHQGQQRDLTDGPIGGVLIGSSDSRAFETGPRKLGQLLRIRQIQAGDPVGWYLLTGHVFSIVWIRFRV